VELKPKETQTQLNVPAEARSEFETYLFLRSVSKAKHGSLLTALQTQCSLGTEQCPDTTHHAVDLHKEQHLNLNLISFLLLKLTCDCSMSPMMTWKHICNQHQFSLRSKLRTLQECVGEPHRTCVHPHRIPQNGILKNTEDSRKIHDTSSTVADNTHISSAN